MTKSIIQFHNIRDSLVAWMLHGLENYMHAKYGSHKQSAFDDLPASIVEIGAGTGTNMRYYRPGTRVIAVEPNPAMHPYLRKAARRYGLQLDLRGIKGERLDLETDSADAVVSTLVLCSVDDPLQVVSEIKRILKPGGRFIFIEHVAASADTPLARAQGLMHGIWHFLFDGCHLNRRTWSTINNAGFRRVAMDCFMLKGPWVLISPHILGVAAN